MGEPIAGSGTRTAKRSDPYPSHSFSVEIGSIVYAQFQECSGPEVSIDVFEYQEGGLNEYVHRLPGRTKYSNVTLRRGLLQDNFIYAWYKRVEGALLEGKPIARQQVTIKLSSTSGSPPMTWVLAEAIPVKWVGPSMKVDTSSLAVEAVEFAHHGITVQVD